MFDFLGVLVAVPQCETLENELVLTIHSCKHIHPGEKTATFKEHSTTVSNSPLNSAVINGNEGVYTGERHTENWRSGVCLSIKILQVRSQAIHLH